MRQDNKKKVFINLPKLKEFAYPPDFPFNITRPDKTTGILNSMGLLNGPEIRQIVPKPAERIVLKKFHTPRYLNMLKKTSQGHFDPQAYYMGIGTEDCPVFTGMYEGAALACGATLTGVDLILTGKADIVFNPSGGLHHAGPEKAAGFCYLNDVALACIVLAEAGKRVLYLDVDVHHGDGVQNAFYDRSDVMTISFHQNPRTLFPGTGFEHEIGEGAGKGYCVNVPFPPETYDEAYLKTFREIVPPLTKVFKPDVIVFELGADALAGDPLANLSLTNNAYAEIIEHLLRFNKPILATGGGGYNIDNTVRAWALAWSVLCGKDDTDANLGLGGVMLENTDWTGGLRDRELPTTKEQRKKVVAALDRTIETLKANLFAIHNL